MGCMGIGILFVLWKYCLCVPVVPEVYTLDKLFNMSYNQKFIIDAWKLPFSWVNPSLTLDPHNASNSIIVWRLPDKSRKDRVGYMHLDSKNLEITKKPDMIGKSIFTIISQSAAENTSELIVGNDRSAIVAEDSRIFVSNGSLQLVYNTHLTRYKRLYTAEIAFEIKFDSLCATQLPQHVSIDHEFSIRHQKNWSPFDYCPDCKFHRGVIMHQSIEIAQPSLAFKPQLLFVYSIVPHRIVHVQPSLTTPHESVAHSVCLTQMDAQYSWDYGEMRGGTPALPINEHSYLSFFHSSGRYNQKHIITYYMGAYLFDRKPPFAITHISPEPLIHQSFINSSLGWAYKVVDYIVFPGGFIFDDDHIHLSYGKNDKESWILKLNRTGLLQSLRPVTGSVLGTSDVTAAGELMPGTFKLHATAELAGNLEGPK